MGKKIVFLTGPKNIQRRRKETFCFHYLHVIPLLSYGLCSCWHGGDGKTHTPGVREPGELLEVIGSGEQREDVLTSDLILDRWEQICEGWRNLYSAVDLLLHWRFCNCLLAHLGKKKSAYSLCWWTCEEGTSSNLQKCNTDSMFLLLEHTEVQGISWDRTQDGKTELITSRATQHLLGWSFMLLLVLYFHSDHWIQVISCKWKICIFFYRLIFIFSLQEKLIWCTDSNKMCQTTVVVTAKLQINNKRKPTSYYTVSLCDIPPYEE